MKESGFGLLEAIIATALIGIASTAALAALSAQLRAVAAAEQRLRAAAAAEYGLASIHVETLTEQRPLGVEQEVSLAPDGDSLEWAAFRVTARTSQDSVPPLLEALVVVRWDAGSHRVVGVLKGFPQ